MPYNGITLKISKSGAENDYWSIQQTSNCTQQVPPVCSKTKTEKYSNLFFVTFNERVAPESVSLITGPGYGILLCFFQNNVNSFFLLLHSIRIFCSQN